MLRRRAGALLTLGEHAEAARALDRAERFAAALPAGHEPFERLHAQLGRLRGLALLDGGDRPAARAALTAAFGKAPVIVGEGGSIPVVGDFDRVLKAPVLLVGFGLPGENAHAPDEWISLENFTRGLRAIATLYEELGASRPGPRTT